MNQRALLHAEIRRLNPPRPRFRIRHLLVFLGCVGGLAALAAVLWFVCFEVITK